MVLKTAVRFVRSTAQRIAVEGESVEQFNKTYDNGVAHVRSYNEMTGEKSWLRLQNPPDDRIPSRGRTKRYELPEKTIDGLKRVILGCNRTPQQLQAEADQKFEKLKQRQMPAEPVGVKSAQQMTKINDHNWKPIAFKSREDAVTYALGFLPMHYSEAKFVLGELDRFGFKPESVLDYGSGVGGTFWAAQEKWNDHLTDYSLVDPNQFAHQFCMDVMRDSETGQLIAPYANFRRSIPAATGYKYDVVVAQRAFSELGSRTSQFELARFLWQKTRKYLVIIESHLPQHFAALMQVRDFLLMMGYKFNPKEIREQLTERGLMSEEIDQLLKDKQASELEKYNVLKSIDGLNIPTAVDVGHVVAPCPHDSGCPLFVGRDYQSSCLHRLKYKETRVDGRSKSQTKSGLFKFSFSYVILAKGGRPPGISHSRLLTKSTTSGCASCRLCTPNEGLQRFQISKRAGPLYTKIRNTGEGHLFPLEEKIVSSDSGLHDIRQIIDDVEKEYLNKNNE
ncbi:hypothetical protein M3Y95_00722900 [Aphelenchoides besseyi]|nr:hypothetical protein M3Y95_00722900 [Aphelenchoides besseyi]